MHCGCVSFVIISMFLTRRVLTCLKFSKVIYEKNQCAALSKETKREWNSSVMKADDILKRVLLNEEVMMPSDRRE